MLYVLQNPEGERAVVAIPARLPELAKLDPVVARFLDVQVVCRLPLDRNRAGFCGALRAVVRDCGAVWPDLSFDTERRIVDASGHELFCGNMARVAEWLEGPPARVWSRYLTGKSFDSVPRAWVVGSPD